ncbi:MAG: hypothetical protein ACLSEY_08030 [Enterocloster sp.]
MLPSELTLATISESYDLDNENLAGLLPFLSISEEEIEETEDNSNLTDIQREKMQFAELAAKYDISPEEAEEMFRAKTEQKKRTAQAVHTSDAYISPDDILGNGELDENLFEDDGETGAEGSSKTEPKKRIQKRHQKSQRILSSEQVRPLPNIMLLQMLRPDDIE